MINALTGSQLRGGVDGDILSALKPEFSSYPSGPAPFGRQSKRRINRDLITRLGGYLLQQKREASSVRGVLGCRSVIRFPLMALHASLGLAKSEVPATLRCV